MNFTSEYASPRLAARFGLCNRPYTFATAAKTRCYFLSSRALGELSPGASKSINLSSRKYRVKSGIYTPSLFLELASTHGVYDYANFKRIRVR